jgi:hypothetical protein
LADAITFERVCEELERRTSFDRLEARGTVRIALKQAGLEPRTVTPEQMKVVVERVLPSELKARGVEDEAAVCDGIAAVLAKLDTGSTPHPDSPDEVFRRLGG